MALPARPACPSAGFIPARDSAPCLKSVSACPRSRPFPAPAPRAWPAPALPRAGGKRPEQNVPKGPSLAGAAAKVTAGGTCGAPGTCRGDGCGSLSRAPVVPLPGSAAVAACSPGPGAGEAPRCPGFGGSAWRQRGLPYLGGKSGAGSAARRGIRVPFTLAALLWSGLPPSPSRPRGGPGRREGWGAAGTPAWGAVRGSGSPCAPCVVAGRDGGCQDGALPLHPTAPPCPGRLLQPDAALWPCTGAVCGAERAPGCARLPMEPCQLWERGAGHRCPPEPTRLAPARLLPRPGPAAARPRGWPGRGANQ